MFLICNYSKFKRYCKQFLQVEIILGRESVELVSDICSLCIAGELITTQKTISGIHLGCLLLSNCVNGKLTSFTLYDAT
jgi:hypothetical protein